MSTSARTATLWLDFSRQAESAATTLRIHRQDVPWRVLRGFPNSAGETLAHLHNISGGILDTDELHLQISVGPSAQAQLTSTGATRIYRSRSPRHCSRSRVEVEVGADGLLEYVPDAVIPYAGSRYEQFTRITLQPRAALLWWELIAPGQEAFGETFGYARFASSFLILEDRRLLLEEHWELEPSLRPLGSPARLGHFRHMASLYICRPGTAGAHWRDIEARLDALASELTLADQVLWGVSRLRAGGIVLRGLACNGRVLMQGLTSMWRAAELSLCGRSASLPRKLY